MGQAGIHTNHHPRATEEGGQFGQTHARRHDGIGNLRGEFTRHHLFTGRAPDEHRHDVRRRETTTKRDPTISRPAFLRPRGRMQHHGISRMRQPVKRALRNLQAKIRATDNRIVKTTGGQAAQSFDRMQTGINSHAAVIKQASQRFTRTTPICTDAQATIDQAGRPCQQGTFQQTLSIEYGVVGDLAHLLAKRFPLGLDRCTEPVRAPAPQRHRQHARHARMHGRQFRVGFFHHPVDDQLSGFEKTVHIRDNGQVVHDVTERTGFDDQDALHKLGSERLENGAGLQDAGSRRITAHPPF